MSLVLLGEATALSTAPADAVLLLPFGAHEQHGPHLPQATDTLIVDAVAREGGQLARAQVALAPTVAYGVSPHHLGLGTTLSLRPRTLLSTVEDLLESAVTGGFSRALLLNGHGGNAGLLATAANEAVANRQILCAFASYWDLAQHDIAALRRSPHGGMGHACELETALLLHLAAHLVDTQAIPADNLGRPGPLLADDMLRPAPLTLPTRMHDEAPTGVLGAPGSADPEQGRQLFTAISRRVAEAIDALATTPIPWESS